MANTRTKPTNRQLVVGLTKAERLAKRFQEEGVSMAEDRRCEMMVMLGFSNRAIRNHLKLTDYQITKIQKAAKIKKVDYRDALTPISKEVVKRLDVLAERRLVGHIAKYLLK